MKTLYLIRGVSGSGKSSLAEEMLAGLMVYYHYEADMYFMSDLGDYRWNPAELSNAHKWCQEQTERRLCDGYSVAAPPKLKLKPTAKLLKSATHVSSVLW